MNTKGKSFIQTISSFVQSVKCPKILHHFLQAVIHIVILPSSLSSCWRNNDRNEISTMDIIKLWSAKSVNGWVQIAKEKTVSYLRTYWKCEQMRWNRNVLQYMTTDNYKTSKSLCSLLCNSASRDGLQIGLEQLFAWYFIFIGLKSEPSPGRIHLSNA